MQLRALRQELAHPRTSVQVCLLGIIAGVTSALLIVLFRLGIDWLQTSGVSLLQQWGLSAKWVWVVMPISAVVVILLIAFLTGFKHYRLGIPFVIHRVKQHYGHIPWRTTVNQFFGGMLALAGGFVVGREGPSVHLGAAGSSLFGQALKLPQNSIRTLAGCGIAAGISASFNTPFAAVIFVMEVVLREYKIHVFVPVMLAAACGSVITRIVFGEGNELAYFSFSSFSQWLYLYLIVFGCLLGVLATLFNQLLMSVMRAFRKVSMVWRLLLAGLLTAIGGALLPEALGASFEDVNALFSTHPTALILLEILLMKFLLATFAIGLGIPGGIIGPVMVLGMLSGAVLLLPVAHWLPLEDFTSSFALLGIAGMLTAVLHAPLAALSAVMELSYRPEIILPAILVIVPAYVTATQFLGNRSIFIQQLDFQKLPYAITSIREALEKTGVLAAMERDFKLFYDAPETALEKVLSNNPTQTVIQQKRFEQDINYSWVHYDVSLDRHAHPISYQAMQGVSAQATLAEVYELLKSTRSGAVYIFEDDPAKLTGVITWNRLQSFLQRAQF
ncbi:MAG: chloride channel protein [Alteromonadaceae bacterium TMED7]|nr:voltage-gated chloride channel [Alteromonadaceae bacterium]MCP4862341.1 chloride channel protein [Alteromonas sp.]RPH22612.1 MAG: chloride channel protein [Alteromonadaceae bacterium TMED7]|tara:strand:+ start:11129 stop:12805 length:1677 start_codon:yes stop_codon:yes gene_type:complete